MIRVSIDGMSCENCVRHVKEALEGLPGASAVEVSLEQNRAALEGGAEVSDQAIRAALDEEGYDVTAVERD